MKVIKALGILSILFVSCDSSVSEEQTYGLNTIGGPVNNIQTAHVDPATVLESDSKIQIALLLDTSGSMGGLIDQAKNQLWEIVNKLADVRNNTGKIPEVEIALYHYGNDGLSVTDNYIKKLHGFTSELDLISESLFALNTDGGEEYCGAVLEGSLNELDWSSREGDIGIVYIAGNEEFSQGPISYLESCSMAKEKGIVVNTIYCGDYQEGINTYWKRGAELAMGKYLNINSDATIVHIDTPYDEVILQKNNSFNNTYLGYGSEGASMKSNQVIQDNNSLLYGSGNASKRALSKGSEVYYNGRWDLVDAMSNDTTFVLADATDLPEEMEDMSLEEKTVYVKEKTLERDEIKAELAELKKLRSEFVMQVKKENAESGESQLNEAIINSIVNQVKDKGYVFIDEK